MSSDDPDRTASLMTPARLAQLRVQPKAAASPAAWLDQLAADAGSGHVRRLAELRRQLASQLRERSYPGVQSALSALSEQAKKLDFDLLRPRGWLARATGRGKEEAAGFLAQAGHTSRAGEDLRHEVRELQRRQQAQNTACERTLLEFDIEVKAIEKIIDQGARWLQDMRNQLKLREAQGGDEAARRAMQEDEARCELLVARLKQLRGASSSAQETAERCKTANGRRAGLAQTLQQTVDGEWRAWQAAIAPVLAEAASSGSATKGIEPARAARDALRSSVQQAASDCAQLEAQEQVLADELAGLDEPLQAAA